MNAFRCIPGEGYEGSVGVQYGVQGPHLIVEGGAAHQPGREGKYVIYVSILHPYTYN
jgi:hypothetical protein